MGLSTDRFSFYIIDGVFLEGIKYNLVHYIAWLGLSLYCLAELPPTRTMERGKRVLWGRGFCLVSCIHTKKWGFFVIFQVFILPAIPAAALDKFTQHSLPN